MALRYVRRKVAALLYGAGEDAIAEWRETGAIVGVHPRVVAIADAVARFLTEELDLVVAFAQANPSLTKAQLLTRVRAGDHRDKTA